MSQSRISLISGGFFDFIDIEQSEFSVEDIANNLSKICRFTGSVNDFYSVAQHSVIVSHVVPPEHALAGLMHDSSEAFMSDLNSPLKALMKTYKTLEKKVEKEILGRLGLPFPMHASIKLADMQVFLAENKQLRGIENCGWYEGIKPYAKKITPWNPNRAKSEFMKRFVELVK